MDGEGGGEESLRSSSFNLNNSEYEYDTDSFFELELRHDDVEEEFEFRVSFSATLDSHPQPPDTPNSWGLLHNKKAGPKNKWRMMNFVVKLRFCVVERWFASLGNQRIMMNIHEILRRNKFFGKITTTSTKSSPTNTIAAAAAAAAAFTSSSSCPSISSSSRDDHHSSLIHSAIAHCNKS